MTLDETYRYVRLLCIALDLQVHTCTHAGSASHNCGPYFYSRLWIRNWRFLFFWSFLITKRSLGTVKMKMEY